MRRIIIGIAVLICLATAAFTQPYGARVTCKQLSPNTWDYTIYNTSTSQDYCLYEIALESGPVDVTLPNGWWADWNGKDGWHWMNSSPNGEPTSNSYVSGVNYESGDYVCIAPGEMLSGFVYHYAYPLTYAQIERVWWAYFFTPSGGMEWCSGYVEPEDTTVPEPTSIITLTIGLIPLGGLILRRKQT